MTFCQFLWTCNPYAFFYHRPGPESYLSEKREMVMDNNIKEHSDYIAYLPDELIRKILSSLPAEVLYRSARLVCKRWAHIVHDPYFVKAHLQQSRMGLFIQSMGSPGIAHFLEMKGGEFIWTEQRHRFPGRILCSCDGVALFSHPYVNTFYVANPVTMEVEVLPHIDPPPFPHHYDHCIARAHSSGQFKVVLACKDLNGEYHWFVLTVGVDHSWREISSQRTYTDEDLVVDNSPASVGGAIYLTDYDFRVGEVKYFPAIDVDHETFHLVPKPSAPQEPSAYVKMGDYLSGIIITPSHLQFDICVLKDWRRGEWTKVYQMNVDFDRLAVQGLFFFSPFCWLRDDEVLILEGFTSVETIYMAYDVKKEETRLLDLSICGRHFSAHVHTNTLVSWTTST